jgi:hypothetical protein
MTATKDHLGPASKKILRPHLERHGFRMLTPKKYLRLCGKIAQYVDLQKSGYGSGNFALNYFIFILVPPRKFIGSILSNRLRGRQNNSWWSSESTELAEASLVDVVRAFDEYWIPLFNRTASLEGYIIELESSLRRGASGHAYLNLGCARVCKGEQIQAKKDLLEAEREYLSHLIDGKVVDWAVEKAEEAKELIAAIDDCTHEALMDRWFRESLSHLKIDESRRKAK